MHKILVCIVNKKTEDTEKTLDIRSRVLKWPEVGYSPWPAGLIVKTTSRSLINSLETMFNFYRYTLKPMYSVKHNSIEILYHVISLMNELLTGLSESQYILSASGRLCHVSPALK